MFKAAVVFDLPQGWTITREELETALGKTPFRECGATDVSSTGWSKPLDLESEPLVREVSGRFLFALAHEAKLIPSQYIKRVARARAAQIEEAEGRKVGRKQLKDITEYVTQEMLPRAFTSLGRTIAFIDPASRILVVGAASPKKAERLIESFHKLELDLPTIRSIDSEKSPIACMSEWLASGEPPEGFTIDRDCELRAVTEEKATVRYVHHALEGEEIPAHLAAGKIPTRLAMTYNDRVSFVLNDTFCLTKISLLDIVTEGHEQPEDQIAAMDADFALWAGEFVTLFSALIDALGGRRQTV